MVQGGTGVFNRVGSADVGEGGGGGGGPHTHGITLSPDSPYSAVEEWTRVASFVDGQMYQTGIEVDTDLEFLHVGLVIDEGTDGADAPRELSYQRIRTAEWEGLELDSTADGAVFQEADNNSGILVYPTDDRYNVISLHLRRYQNADGDDLLSVGVQIASDQPSNDIRGIKYFYENPVTAITGNTASAGGGGGGGGGYVDVSEDRHPPTITEDNYKNLFVDFNEPPRVWQGYRATHVHEDATGDFTNVVDSDLIDPGVFRDDAHAGSPSAFMMYFSTSRHSWRARVLHEGRGVVPDRWVWVDYSWHSTRSRLFTDTALFLGEADTDAELVAQVSNHDAAINYYGINLTTHRVRFLTNSSYVAPVDETPTYGASPIVPAEKADMMFWGADQDGATPSDLVARVRIGGDRYRLLWDTDGPNQILAGVNPGVEVLEVAPTTADLIPADGTDAGETPTQAAGGFIQLPGGRTWEVSVFWATKATSDSDNRMALYQVRSGADDVIRQRGTAFAQRNTDPLRKIVLDDAVGQTTPLPPTIISVTAGEVAQITAVGEGPNSDLLTAGYHYARIREL